MAMLIDIEKARAEIREVLLHAWDPIGISDLPEARDEYDAYADDVLSMLADEDTTAEEIADYLLKIATEHMGLSEHHVVELCGRAAKAVVSLKASF
ncbi:hypothetical protein ILFOPFJJ_01654 [Ensifer psoraleae]|uniref:hypothetical protein n=1 Tax=Sinorhizobium psoraleae TaxID=520838 RepID=UPI001FE2FFAA|nr:hypothetical protein [Sinorhizobium psoraleae]NRP70772.1 hypothetical protein [Sinorhizobium psoraleae]